MIILFILIILFLITLYFCREKFQAQPQSDYKEHQIELDALLGIIPKEGKIDTTDPVFLIQNTDNLDPIKILNPQKNVYYNVKEISSDFKIKDNDLKKKINEGGNLIINKKGLNINKLCINNSCFDENVINKNSSKNLIKYSYDPNDFSNENLKINIPEFKDKDDKYVLYDKNNTTKIPYKLCFGDDCITKSDLDVILGKTGVNLKSKNKASHIGPYNITFGARGMGFSDVQQYLFYKNKDYTCPPSQFNKTSFNCFANEGKHYCRDDSNRFFPKESLHNNYRIIPATNEKEEIVEDKSYYHIH